MKIMLFLSELILFVTVINSVFASWDPPMKPLIDGSKYAFIRAPYVNTVRIQKDLVLEDDVSVRWSNGIVRFFVDGNSYDAIFETLLRTPMHIIMSSSCIGFISLKEKPQDNNPWIHITNPRKERECNHEPKVKDSGEIELVFGYDCLKSKEIIHTLLHGVGIKDEVTHPHRDKYIRVLWDNIHPAYQHLYRKQADKSPKKALVEYDPLSVMHFHDRAFSRNGHATVAPLEPGLMISPSDSLSQLDKMRLQMYFGHECNKRKVSYLLKTCKKSLGGVDSEDNMILGYSANKVTTAANNNYNVPDEREIYTDEKDANDKQINTVEGLGTKETDGQVAEIQEEESYDAEGQDEESQNTDIPRTEGLIEEDQSTSEIVNERDEDRLAIKGEVYETDGTETKDGESGNTKNIEVKVDEENEEGTNVDIVNSGKKGSVKKQLDENTYNFNITQHTSQEKSLKLAHKQIATYYDDDQNDWDNDVLRQ